MVVENSTCPEISIITSAYNAENTIIKTIESVLSQTYKNFEYIIVDHGSKDRTKQIIESFIVKDNRIKIVELKKNEGYIGSAINIGISHSAGKYFAFLDSDDQYEHEFLERMYKAIKSGDFDIAICGFNYRDEYNHRFRTVKLEKAKQVLTESNYVEFWAEMIDVSYGFLYVWWNKLYRRDFLERHQLTFSNKMKVHADAIFNADVLNCNPKVYCCEEVLTNWTCISGSVSYGNYQKGYFDEALTVLSVYIKLTDKFILDQVLREQFYKKSILSVASLQRISFYKESTLEILAELFQWVNDSRYINAVITTRFQGYVNEYLTNFLPVLLAKEDYSMKGNCQEYIQKYFNRINIPMGTESSGKST